MTYSIVCSSKTGNTRLLAEAIHGALNKEDCLYFGEPSRKALEADLIFVGFWTDKGICDPDTEAFLRTVVCSKIALFGTAGFGGARDYFDTILARSTAHIPAGNTLLDGFMCQGKMPAAVRARYEQLLAEKPEDAKIKGMLENFDSALSHPDVDDLRGVAEFAVQVLDNV